MACTQINTNQSDKQEDRMPGQKNMGISSVKNVTDGRQGNDSEYEATKNKFTQ